VPGADAMRLDEAAEVFRSHPLDAGPYTFVAADTLVLKVRENGRVVRTFSLVDSDTKVDVNTGIVPTGRLQSLTEFRDYGIDIAELRVQLGKISEAVRSVVPQSMWGGSSTSWRSWSSTRRRSTSGRTPSMMPTTSPSTRPSSSTMTTSSDLRSARRHRGRWGTLPVWTGVRGS